MTELPLLALFAKAIGKVLLGTGIGPGVLIAFVAEKTPARIYIYRWAKVFGMPSLGGERKGQECKILVRGNQNTALIEFPDGLQAVVSRNALRKKGA